MSSTEIVNVRLQLRCKECGRKWGITVGLDGSKIVLPKNDAWHKCANCADPMSQRDHLELCILGSIMMEKDGYELLEQKVLPKLDATAFRRSNVRRLFEAICRKDQQYVKDHEDLVVAALTMTPTSIYLDWYVDELVKLVEAER